MLEAVDAAERFIRRNTRQAEPIPKGRLRREPLPEYSTVMIRELLINAVAHTDYSKSGETIKAFVYDDRIEIHNPGTDAARHHHGRHSRGPLKDPQPWHRWRAAAHPLHGALRHCLGKDRARGGPWLSRATARRGWARVHSDDLATLLVRRLASAAIPPKWQCKWRGKWRGSGPRSRQRGSAPTSRPGRADQRRRSERSRVEREARGWISDAGKRPVGSSRGWSGPAGRPSEDKHLQGDQNGVEGRPPRKRWTARRR